MLDFLRDLRKSSEEKQQEALNAYLDGALTPPQLSEFEKDLAQSEDLQTQLEQMRVLQQQMRQMPRRQVPRNFTLDPAVYGRPVKEPLIQAYPILRTATVLTAFIFVFVLAASIFMDGNSMQSAGSSDSIAAVAEPEMDMAAEESMNMEAPAETVVEEAEAVEEAQEAADEVISGELEMPAEAQMAPPDDDLQEESLPLATMELEAESEEEAQELRPKVESTIVVEESLAYEAAGAATMDTESYPGVLPEAGLPPLEPEIDRAPTSDGVLAYGVNFDSLTSILLILGLVFIILLFLTLLARRRF